MKLIHKSTGLEAKIGDIVHFPSLVSPCRIAAFSPPHKPASEGRVTVLDWNNNYYERYVSVFGLKWIDREDRQEQDELSQPTQVGGIKNQSSSVVRTADQTTIKQISEMQKSLARYQDDLDKIEALIDGYVDGSGDCSEASCLANKIMRIIHPEG